MGFRVILRKSIPMMMQVRFLEKSAIAPSDRRTKHEKPSVRFLL
jgi:hypothetical protein